MTGCSYPQFIYLFIYFHVDEDDVQYFDEVPHIVHAKQGMAMFCC